MSDADPAPAEKPAEPTAGPVDAGGGAVAEREAGYKELFENLVIALVLAFMARTFLVEPFVIPTGSMAPTLLGAHMAFVDPDSGQEWPVGYRSIELPGNDVFLPDRAVKSFAENPQGRGIQPVQTPQPQVFPIFGPSSLYRLPATDEPGEPDRDAVAPRVRAGDRILVQKYAYLFRDPQRWDVVVFKNPSPQRHPPGDRYQDNYIKRLVGVPGDTLMVLDGDLYVSRSDRPVETLTPDDFEIARKTEVAQKALWRIVYDHDHRPVGRPRTITTPRGRAAGADPTFRVPWVGGDEWTLDAGPAGRSIAVETDGVATLSFDPDLNGIQMFSDGGAMSGVLRPMLTDWVPYNVTDNFPLARSPADVYLRPFVEPDALDVVTDVMLEFDYERRSGSGPLELTVSRRDTTFTVELTSDAATLSMAVGDGLPVELQTAAVDASGLTHVELRSVDHRVSLWLDGEEVLATTPEQHAPDVAALLAEYEAGGGPPKPTVEVAAVDQAATLHHVKLWRDVHYMDEGNALRQAVPRGFPANVLRLGEDEFFTLGDNSPVSADGRYWDKRVVYEGLDVDQGKVPRRFILGKAFFVYWPAAYDLPWGLGQFRLTPNVGKMRLIR